MKITCETVTVRGRVPTAYDAPELGVECGKPAAILLLITELEDNGWNDNSLDAWGACEVHAARETHELRSSMGADEFIVINLTAGARLEAVRKYADGMRTSFIHDHRIMANDILDIINSEVTS